MKEKTETFNQGKRYFFYILMFAILGWFIFMQIFGADERSSDTSAASVIYSGTVTWQKPDGTTQEISVPGTYKVPVGDTMVLTIQLPDDLTDTCFAIRSSLQDVDFYVGDNLRTSYSTHKTRLVGKNSASRYVFCPVYASDAGKELRIELTTYTSNYTGVVNPVYCGNKADIWIYIFSRYGLETYIAFFILFAGIVTILFSFALGLVYHTRFDTEYLGWCMVMGAVWMLGESKLRQFLVPNASALGSLCFVMILLCPLPILFFADSLQKGLHHRFYVCLGSIAMINFAVCTILTAAGIADYIETMPVSHGILAITVATIFVHLFQYIRTEKNKADRLLLIGLLAAILCIAVEATSVYFVTLMSGLFVGAGMLILLFVNIVRAIKNVQDIELKRQQSEIRKNQEQNEKMSLQMDDLFQKFHTITTDDPELRFATLSAGLCLCSTDDSFEDCYSKADKALYYVKQNGKNQFFFYQQIDRSTLAASGSGKDLALVAESLQKSGIYVGALDLNYRDFARQYEYMSQLVTRSQCRCYLAMITIETLVDTVPDIESIEQALEYMEQAIRQNIRRVDICTRYSSLQYLIILFEPDETHIPDIIERIFTQYYCQCDSHDFQPSYEYLEISPQEL